MRDVLNAINVFGRDHLIHPRDEPAGALSRYAYGLVFASTSFFRRGKTAGEMRWPLCNSFAPIPLPIFPSVGTAFRSWFGLHGKGMLAEE